MGLNNNYTAITGNILVMVPFPSMSQAYSLLGSEEKARSKLRHIFSVTMLHLLLQIINQLHSKNPRNLAREDLTIEDLNYHVIIVRGQGIPLIDVTSYMGTQLG